MHGKNVEKNSFGRLYRSNGTKTILDVALIKNMCINDTHILKGLMPCERLDAL